MSTTDETLAFLADLEQQHQTAEAPAAAPGNRRHAFMDGWSSGYQAASFGGGFAGGKVDRLTADWQPGQIGPNRTFRMDGKLLRQRARDLVDNNPFAISAIDAYLANVIECGMVFERDEGWEKAWELWGGLRPHSGPECDFYADQTIDELARSWFFEVMVGGGCLTHFLPMPRRSQRIPLALELIPEERFAEHLTTWGRNNKTANRIIDGMEVDPHGRVVAWHVLKAHPNDDPEMDPLATLRIPRENGEYAFIKDRPQSRRGTTILKQAIMWLWALGYYTDNELAASTAKSSWAMIIKRGKDSTANWEGVETEQSSQLTDINGNPVSGYEPAMVWHGGDGDSIEGIGPNVPQGESTPWLLMIQRAIAVGVRLSYEEVFRDYSKGSFSSVRMARGQDIKRYKPHQRFALSRFYNPTLRRFDLAAVGAMFPGLPSPQQYLSERDDILDRHEWQTPGWESPNPRDDALADDIRLTNRTDTRHNIAGRRGLSYRRLRTQTREELKDMRADETLPPSENPAAQAAAEMPDNAAEPEDP